MDSSQSITLCDGTTAKGQGYFGTPCTADGQSNCLVADNFVATDIAKFSASDVMAAKAIGGVAGTVENCTLAGSKDCVTTAALTSTTAKCTSEAQVGCWATGSYRAVNVGSLDATKVLAGTSIAGVSGLAAPMKYCRNGMNYSRYNYDGASSGITNTGNTAGNTNGDWWDTIDDLNNNLGAASLTALIGTPAWSGAYLCDGSQISDVTNSKSWLTPSGASLNCSGTTCTNAAARTFNKIYYDPYADLYVTNVLITNGGTAGQGAYWDEAVDGCYNLQSGDGVGKWRLPLQKEFYMLYVGGMYLQDVAKFSNQLYNEWIWTGTNWGGANGWYMVLMRGGTVWGSKTTNYAVMCVR